MSITKDIVVPEFQPGDLVDYSPFEYCSKQDIVYDMIIVEKIDNYTYLVKKPKSNQHGGTCKLNVFNLKKHI